jgi:hypothetical protein
MKSPMHQRPDDEAHALTEAFIAKYSRDAVAKPVVAKRKAASK